MNIGIIHDGNKRIRNKLKEEIDVREYHYVQVLKGDWIQEQDHAEQLDYVLLTMENDSVIKAVTRKIKDGGIPEEKILVYKYYEQNACDNSFMEIDKFLHSNDTYDGLIIGMSHSICGIKAEVFDNRLFKMGVASIDLYYMKKLIEMLIETKKLVHCSYVILELPYYMFNWDISRSSKAYDRFSLLHYFNDYHHFGEDNAEQLYIHKMRTIDTFMKERLLTYNDKERRTDYGNTKVYNDAKWGVIKSFCQCIILESKEQWRLKRHGCEQKYKIWERKHKKTIYENKMIWDDIVSLIKNEALTADIFLTVFPQNPYFIKCNRDSVQNMKRIFYTMIGEDERITVIDHVHRMGVEFNFMDECHMNDFGAYIYSNMLRKELKRLGCVGVRNA